MNRFQIVLCTTVLAVAMADQAQAAGKKHKAPKPDYAALAAADQAAADPGADFSTPVQQAQSFDQYPATAAGIMSTSLANPVPKAVVVSGSARDLDARFELSVNNAPAAQVFLQLGLNTGYNILVSPELSGAITIGLKNTTVPEALEVLRELFGYDYRIAGNRVFVYPNTVQTRIYRINYLPGRRQGLSELHVSSSSIQGTGGSNSGSSSGGSSNSSSGGSSGSSSGGSSSNSGARSDDTAHVRTTSDSDFWKEVQESLVSMVGTANGRGVVMNPAAGVVVIRATPAEHRHVTDFLKAVQVNIERQVMLEAKIVEVQLTSSSATGVNWSLFGNHGSRGGGIANLAPGVTLKQDQISSADVSITKGPTFTAGAAGFYGLAVQTTNFMALINFLQTQGDVQVLSSPRIATMNNQKAVLKVGSDELFVTGVKTDSTSSGNNTVTTPTLTLQPFFSGISLDVTPQIDDSGMVMMHIHPAISAVTEKQKTIDLGNLGLYKLPLATSSINETDSIVKVMDGHIVAIGGLMRVTTTADRNGVPGLSEVPGVGGLFRQKETYTNKRELVVLIRPTVIGEDGSGWMSNEPNTSMISPPTPSR